jgi:hypothetical protein
VELEITEREWTFEMCVWLERERETDRQRQRDLVQWRELAGGSVGCLGTASFHFRRARNGETRGDLMSAVKPKKKILYAINNVK